MVLCESALVVAPTCPFLRQFQLSWVGMESEGGSRLCHWGWIIMGIPVVSCTIWKCPSGTSIGAIPTTSNGTLSEPDGTAVNLGKYVDGIAAPGRDAPVVMATDDVTMGEEGVIIVCDDVIAT